jgi:translation initiation factor 2 beta subunit (eIF-2beta)/eIF-5
MDKLLNMSFDERKSVSFCTCSVEKPEIKLNRVYWCECPRCGSISTASKSRDGALNNWGRL